MKITPNHSPMIQNDAYLKNSGKNKAAEASTNRVQDAVRGTDSVVLSQEARELQAAQKAMASVPEVRSEKIARIKEQLRSGTYHSDPAKIATGMIKESLVNIYL